jgi:hypothetical protein
MNTWNTVTCATIPLDKLSDYGVDWGFVQFLWFLNGGPPGGYPGWYADITHAGWLPGGFFDWALGPGASGYVLGATFTFAFGSPPDYTDLDNNGKIDVAFREIYYNDAFTWGIDPIWPVIDVETVVLHEMGHALSLDHFGKLFQTDKNGKFHFAPRAVMNAGYNGVQQDLAGTDNGAFCSVWDGWPD